MESTLNQEILFLNTHFLYFIRGYYYYYYSPIRMYVILKACFGT